MIPSPPERAVFSMMQEVVTAASARAGVERAEQLRGDWTTNSRRALGAIPLESIDDACYAAASVAITRSCFDIALERRRAALEEAHGTTRNAEMGLAAATDNSVLSALEESRMRDEEIRELSGPQPPKSSEEQPEKTTLFYEGPPPTDAWPVQDLGVGGNEDPPREVENGEERPVEAVPAALAPLPLASDGPQSDSKGKGEEDSIESDYDVDSWEEDEEGDVPVVMATISDDGEMEQGGDHNTEEIPVQFEKPAKSPKDLPIVPIYPSVAEDSQAQADAATSEQADLTNGQPQQIEKITEQSLSQDGFERNAVASHEPQSQGHLPPLPPLPDTLPPLPPLMSLPQLPLLGADVSPSQEENSRKDTIEEAAIAEKPEDLAAPVSGGGDDDASSDWDQWTEERGTSPLEQPAIAGVPLQTQDTSNVAGSIGRPDSAEDVNVATGEVASASSHMLVDGNPDSMRSPGGALPEAEEFNAVITTQAHETAGVPVSYEKALGDPQMSESPVSIQEQIPPVSVSPQQQSAVVESPQQQSAVGVSPQQQSAPGESPQQLSTTVPAGQDFRTSEDELRDEIRRLQQVVVALEQKNADMQNRADIQAPSSIAGGLTSGAVKESGNMHAVVGTMQPRDDEKGVSSPSRSSSIASFLTDELVKKHDSTVKPSDEAIANGIDLSESPDVCMPEVEVSKNTNMQDDPTSPAVAEENCHESNQEELKQLRTMVLTQKSQLKQQEATIGRLRQRLRETHSYVEVMQCEWAVWTDKVASCLKTLQTNSVHEVMGNTITAHCATCPPTKASPTPVATSPPPPSAGQMGLDADTWHQVYDFMPVSEAQKMADTLEECGLGAVCGGPEPPPPPPPDRPTHDLGTGWERQVKRHFGVGPYLGRSLPAERLSSEEIREKVSDFAQTTHVSDPDDACKYLAIEEYRCLLSNQAQLTSVTHSCLRNQRDPRAAGTKCLKWHEEWRRCQWDQHKFNEGLTYLEGPPTRRGYRFAPNYKYA